MYYICGIWQTKGEDSRSRSPAATKAGGATPAHCFDAADNSTGFASASSEIVPVGANLKEPPATQAGRRHIALTTDPCDHLMLYVYIIPHTLPADNDIDATRPFDIELRISCNGRRIRSEKRRINQWSGASIELRVAAAGK